MLASYADTFASTWGRKAREVLHEESGLFGVTLDPVTTGGQEWNMLMTAQGRKARGVMVTAGVGGGLTGKGAHFLVIDDPVKNAEEAQSQTTRDAHWNWWLSTVRTRLQKGAGVILVMTRWHEDDLAGRFLANDPLRDKSGELLPEGERREDVDGDHWEVLNLPAFAEAPDDEVDRESWRDAMGRAEGDVLWPEMFDADWMDQTRRAQGTYWFSAMYQQRPAPASGLHFKRDTFQYHDVEALNSAGEPIFTLYRKDGTVELVDSSYCQKYQTCDCAASEDEAADYTVVNSWYVTPQRDVLIDRVIQQRRDTTKMPGFLEQEFWMFRPMWQGIERIGFGLNAIQVLLKKGLPIVKLEADRDKLSRSIPSQVLYSNGKVFHRKGAFWLSDFEDQMLKFPNASHDDMVDTVSYIGIKLPETGSGAMPRSSSNAEKRGTKDREPRAPRGDRSSHTAGVYKRVW